MWKAALLLALLPIIASAEEAAPNGCHAIAAAEARLSCYDQQSGFQPAAAEAAVPSEAAAAGVWSVSSEQSALEDRTDIWLSVTSENTQPNQIGRAETASLWVRCMANKTNVLLAFNSYTSDDQNVKFRLDEGKIAAVYMQTVNGGKGLGLWSGKTAIPFIKGLFGKSKLVVAYRSYGNDNLEFVFDVTGLREQIGDLAAACGWAP